MRSLECALARTFGELSQGQITVLGIVVNLDFDVRNDFRVLIVSVAIGVFQLQFWNKCDAR